MTLEAFIKMALRLVGHVVRNDVSFEKDLMIGVRFLQCSSKSYSRK